MNIQDIIKSISNFKEILIPKDDCKFKILAQKYDKNKNSIFETDELEDIKTDLLKFASEDEDKESLSEAESRHFLESMLDEKQSLFDFVEDPRVHLELSVKNIFDNLFVTGKDSSRRKYIKEHCNDKYLSDYDMNNFLNLSDEEFERAKQLFYVENREKQIRSYEIPYIAKLSEEEYERAKQLLYVEDRVEQFSANGIIQLAKLNDEEFEKAKQLFYVENRDEQFSATGITKLAKLSEEEFERAEQLFYLEDRKEQFSGEGIAALATLDSQEYERAKPFFYIENRKKQIDGILIAELAKMDEQELERAQSLLTLKKKETWWSEEDGIYNVTIGRFNDQEILNLIKLSDEDFKRAKKLFNIKTTNNFYLDGDAINELVKLNDSELNRAIKIMKKKDEISTSHIIPLAKLNDEEYERAKNLFGIKNGDGEVEYKDIAELAKLSDEELSRAQSLFDIQDKNLYIPTDMIIQLVKSLTPEEFDFAKKYLIRESMEIKDIIAIAKNRNSEIEQILEQDVKFKVCYTADDSVKLLFLKGDEFICQTFDKSGIVETEEKSATTYPNFKDCSITTLYNKKLNVKQEIITGYAEGDVKSIEMELDETLTYYNDDNSIKKIVKFKKDPQKGLLNVSETDAEGNTKPIQWSAVDSWTCGNVIERHLVSPDGVRTDFYSEEGDDTKITDYVISDAQGKLLANIHQTFQKVSENKFITSINVTNDKKNTQIYEIEYKDNYVVEIFDKKNNKTTTMDLLKYIDKDSIEKLMPIIKQLPGHVLLEFEEKPFQLRYGKEISMNGRYSLFKRNPAEAGNSRILVVGNFEDSFGGEKENMFDTLVHELGHYLDLYFNKDGRFSTDPEILAVFEKEFEAFKQKTTSVQQKYICSFTKDSSVKSARERVAESHALMYSTYDPMASVRQLYFAQYFPQTIALIMKRELEEEGIKTS